MAQFCSIVKSVVSSVARGAGSGGAARSMSSSGMSKNIEQKSSSEKVTLAYLRQKYRRGEPLTLVTAYDYPSGIHVDSAGIDMCVVGDSAAMVVHGHDNTLPITLDQMLLHCRAVARGVKRAFLVGDLPFGSYESSTQQAVDSSMRLLKEGGVSAIKLEGASPSQIACAKAIVDSGIAVMGHIGLTPQHISVLGGFRAQGRNVSDAIKMVETALKLEEAGCFSIVFECIPAPVAAAVTSVLKIPTIGAGAGPFCSGQALIYHDIIGMFQHENQKKVVPKFCKQYVESGDVIHKGLTEFKKEVQNGAFPGATYSPYKINSDEMNNFFKGLQSLGFDGAASAAAEVAEKMDKAYNKDMDSQLFGNA